MTTADATTGDVGDERSEFGAATAVRRDGAAWAGEIVDGWGIGGIPNGGYVMAIAASAVLAETGRRDPVSFTTQFLAPAGAGPFEAHVEVARSGRRHTSAVATLRQGERDFARVLAVLGELDAAAHALGDVGDSGDARPPDLPEPGDCTRLEPAPGLVFQPPPIMERVEIRVPPAEAGFAAGEPPGAAVVSGWARFADGRPADTHSLLLFADAFPPAVFNAGLPMGWVPTVDLSVQVRKPPASGWLRCIFRTRFLTGDYLEEDGEIWDADGDLVALSRQLALVARPSSG